MQLFHLHDELLAWNQLLFLRDLRQDFGLFWGGFGANLGVSFLRDLRQDFGLFWGKDGENQNGQSKWVWRIHRNSSRNSLNHGRLTITVRNFSKNPYSN